MWPHVLSLDAPVVALVWQHWWADVAGVKVLWFQDVILALGVWMIYLADRLVDTRRGDPESLETARHGFSQRHGQVLWPLLGCVMAWLAVLTLLVLPKGQFVAGLGLLLVAGGYFWGIHRPRSAQWTAILPKEAFVGAIFALGTAFFAAWQIGPALGRHLTSLVLFALLCFLNCALITRWESSTRDRREPSSLLNAFPWLPERLAIVCLGLAVLAAGLARGDGSVELTPIALSALVLAGLDRWRKLISVHALRVLADLALLAPLLHFVRLRP